MSDQELQQLVLAVAGGSVGGGSLVGVLLRISTKRLVDALKSIGEIEKELVSIRIFLQQATDAVKAIPAIQTELVSIRIVNEQANQTRNHVSRLERMVIAIKAQITNLERRVSTN